MKIAPASEKAQRADAPPAAVEATAQRRSLYREIMTWWAALHAGSVWRAFDAELNRQGRS